MLSFGTDNAVNKCKAKFPYVSHCLANVTKVGDNNNYELTTKGSTKKIYGFFEIKDNI